MKELSELVLSLLTLQDLHMSEGLLLSEFNSRLKEKFKNKPKPIYKVTSVKRGTSENNEILISVILVKDHTTLDVFQSLIVYNLYKEEVSVNSELIVTRGNS